MVISAVPDFRQNLGKWGKYSLMVPPCRSGVLSAWASLEFFTSLLLRGGHYQIYSLCTALYMDRAGRYGTSSRWSSPILASQYYTPAHHTVQTPHTYTSPIKQRYIHEKSQFSGLHWTSIQAHYPRNPSLLDAVLTISPSHPCCDFVLLGPMRRMRLFDTLHYSGPLISYRVDQTLGLIWICFEAANER